MVLPTVSFGDDNEYLKDVMISVDADSPFGQGPTGKALRQDQPFWCQDFLNTPINVPWFERALQAGFAALASLPLHREGLIVGAFTLYSAEVNAFDESARDLLTEMATDISFALDNFVRENQRQSAQQELQFKNTVLMTQQENSLDAILVADQDDNIISYNQKFIELWQLSPSLVRQGLGGPILQLASVQTEHPEALFARIEYLKEHKDTKTHEEIRFKDGRVIEHHSAPVLGEDGKHYGRVWYFRDITERKLAETKIAFLNRVYAVLSGINSLIVRVLKRDELFNEACRIAVEEGGFRMAMIAIVEQRTMNIIPVASEGKDQALLVGIEGILSSSADVDNTMIARALREKRVVVSNDSQNDPQVILGKKYLESGVSSIVILPLIVEDIAVGVIALYASEIAFFHEAEINLLTELAGNIAFAVDHIDKQEQLNYLACYDALTGLANRRLFLDRVKQHVLSAIDDSNMLAVALIDLERFTSINDSLGRATGDALLIQVADWLKSKTDNATWLARLDVDHFALVLPKVSQYNDLVLLVESVLSEFQQHAFSLNDSVFKVGIKVGLALFPEDGCDADILLRNAEAALKKAKVNGDRYLFHTHNMTEAVASKLSLENQLRQAIDSDEFVLHYQPKVNLVSGKVTSAEALIRWNDPNNGLVPPAQFIPTLEETGLIHEVGRWALGQAIDDYLGWCEKGLVALPIAVNVSPMQLRNRDFITEIARNIGVDARAANGLELEITESLIMADVKHSIVSLELLRAMGVTIAIDDFGTGFSSLSYLAKLPVDTLKIDSSFVVDMTTGPEALALVSTIVQLAHALKLKVVAEGVETEEQKRLLRLLGCDEMQGYLFSKPVPADIFAKQFLTQASLI